MKSITTELLGWSQDTWDRLMDWAGEPYVYLSDTDEHIDLLTARIRWLEAGGDPRGPHNASYYPPEPAAGFSPANDQTMPVIRTDEQLRGCAEALKELIQGAAWIASCDIDQRIDLVRLAAFEWVRENLAKARRFHVSQVDDNHVLTIFAGLVVDGSEPDGQGSA